MCPFMPTIVELDYDFTNIPKVGGAPGEKCTGKGVIPEPTDEQIDAYLKVGKDLKSPDVTFTEIRAAWTDALVELGMPRDHLAELPLSMFHKFVDHVMDELLPNGGRSASTV
jgi:hypothetical protein